MVIRSLFTGLMSALIGAGLIWAGPATAEPIKLPGIKGTDDRVRVAPDRYPWTAIGRLNRRTGGHCTATVITSKWVLTAAHCLYNKRTQRYLPPVSLHFVAGWSKGEYLFHTKAVAVHPSPDFRPAVRTPINAAKDWALVELAEDPTPQTGSVPLKVDPGPTFPALIQAGYSQDKAHVLTVNRRCRGTVKLAAKEAPLLVHDCDTVKGDSGSPVITEQNGKFGIVAIHVATLGKTSTTGLSVLVAPVESFIKSLRR